MHWPGKEAMMADGSISHSKEEKYEVYTANAMEEYMRKQAAKKAENAALAAKAGGKAVTAKPAEKAAKDFSESSDRYTDEDFDSMSKSASAFSGLPKVQGRKPKVEITYDPSTNYGG